MFGLFQFGLVEMSGFIRYNGGHGERRLYKRRGGDIVGEDWLGH